MAEPKAPQPAFDPSPYLSDIKGKQYLEVKWRLLWFRTLHPDGVITTELMSHDPQKGAAVFRAHVAIPGGGQASGWGSETAADFGEYLEKAETKAVGRALAALGFGTQFTGEAEAEERARETDGSRGGASGAPREPATAAAPSGRAFVDGLAGRAGDGPLTKAQQNAIVGTGGARGYTPAVLTKLAHDQYQCGIPDLTAAQATAFLAFVRELPMQGQRGEG